MSVPFFPQRFKLFALRTNKILRDSVVFAKSAFSLRRGLPSKTLVMIGFSLLGAIPLGLTTGLQFLPYTNLNIAIFIGCFVVVATVMANAQRSIALSPGSPQV